MMAYKNDLFINIKGHTVLNKFNNHSIIIDLGANKGNFAREFADNFNFNKIILVEADTKLVDKIHERLNKYQNIIIDNSLVGGQRKEKVPFYLSNNTETNSLNKKISNKYGIHKTIYLPMVTLND